LLAAEAALKALMLTALAGDKAAYRALLEATGSLLRRYYGRRLAGGVADVEDLVQEALIAIHSKRDTFDTSQPLTPWLYAIARYKLLDHLRRRRIRVTIPLEDAGELLADDESAAADARLDLEKLLANLPAGTQEIIRAVKIEGQTTSEVADRKGKSEIAVRVGLHRGLKALGEKLREGTDRADR